jgi:hypothetical protein
VRRRFCQPTLAAAKPWALKLAGAQRVPLTIPDHGCAVTSHSAQNLTAERVLIHADTCVHPDLLSSRFGYVAVSRASQGRTTNFILHFEKIGGPCICSGAYTLYAPTLENEAIFVI